MSKTTSKFSPEVRERAVRLALDNEVQHPSRWQAVVSIAAKIGCTPQTLNDWVKKAEVDSGRRGEWTEHGGHPARFLFATVSRPSRTAALLTATRCAPLGDHRIRLRFPMRALAMSSTDPSARDDEMGSPLRYRRP